MDKVKLKPCPFCGKEVAKVVDQYELNDLPDDGCIRMYTVVCDYDDGGCGATCGFTPRDYNAVKRWNVRLGG